MVMLKGQWIMHPFGYPTSNQRARESKFDGRAPGKSSRRGADHYKPSSPNMRGKERKRGGDRPRREPR